MEPYRLRKALEGLPKPPLGKIDSPEDLLKSPPALYEVHSTFAQLEVHYQAALDNARECNIMDTLDEMTMASDSGQSLVDATRRAFRERLITQEKYMDIMEAVDGFLATGLPENVAKVILNNCECSKR